MRALVLLLLVVAAPAAGQDTLRLSSLQRAAIEKDPRLRQVELLEAQTELRLRNLAVERLPQLSATGEAKYQSEVPAVPIDVPGMEVPAPPKDQVEAAINTDLLLYDGGAIQARRRIERARLEATRAELAAELYPLRTEVMEAYFSALLLQERMREVEALVADLEARLAEVRVRVRAGAALPGDTAAIRAEMLGAMEQRRELAADRRASLDVLELLTGRSVSGADVLALPDLSSQVARVDPADVRAHPQYAVFAAERERLEREIDLLEARLRPQASAFSKVAYGRPGLELFTDELHDYWVGGVRVQWAPWDWGTNRREREALRLQQQVVDTDEAAFTARLERQVRRPLQQMERLQAAIERDLQIVALREQVARQARVQFEERVITASAYVDALTDLQQARVSLRLHRVELAQARATYLTALGVELR